MSILGIDMYFGARDIKAIERAIKGVERAKDGDFLFLSIPT